MIGILKPIISSLLNFFSSEMDKKSTNEIQKVLATSPSSFYYRFNYFQFRPVVSEEIIKVSNSNFSTYQICDLCMTRGSGIYSSYYKMTVLIMNSELFNYPKFNYQIKENSSLRKSLSPELKKFLEIYPNIYLESIGDSVIILCKYQKIDPSHFDQFIQLSQFIIQKACYSMSVNMKNTN